MFSIKKEEIEEILGFKLHEDLIVRLNELKYDKLTIEEKDNYLLDVINYLLKDSVVKSGDHRISDWESGWKENLDNFKEKNDINCLIPKYHGKYNLLRWNGEIIKSVSKDLDYHLHTILVDAIIRNYIGDNNNNIFEFGCGPGYHLIRLNNFNKNLNLHGGDWTTTSQDTIKSINQLLNLNITPFNFNFFKPDYNLDIPKNSAIYTVAALEQVGDNYKDFVQFLLEKSPNICIHMEPISELLDQNKLLDKLSISYFKKRNYLNEFLPYLESLEREGKIEIIKKQRIFYGSYFIEGHSLVVWKKI